MTDFRKEKETLFDSIGLTNMDHRVLLDFLIKTSEDLLEFVEFFLSENLGMCINKYRIFKKGKVYIEYIMFAKEYAASKKIALQNILQEPISATKVSLVNGIDPKIIYNEHKLNIHHTFISLHRNIINGTTSAESELFDCDPKYLLI
ncbi:hypothetical protein JOC34_000515 [Virgibacillus halotolerans]|uniref:hypothetical protein n=1 Tax=Virgibacillus halotolerans TaxID=1071053 RepID=UPI001961F1E5|nr:hypothetical protein [Virgibacillus halotolerans]MBM7598158.1 hypothetical protein [Virgibacillus halotolerans]